MVTAVLVTYGSAFPALNHGKEMEKNRDLSEAAITLNRSRELMIPVMSSCSLILMFYLFSSVSQLLTAFTASLFFCLAPYDASLRSRFGLADPLVSRCCSKSFTRTQGLLVLACADTVGAWLVSGHWLLNKILGISICVAFVSHVRLPNIKICTMLPFVCFSMTYSGFSILRGFLVQMLWTRLKLSGLQLVTEKTGTTCKNSIL